MKSIAIGLALALGVVGPAAALAQGKSEEREIPLSDVPPHVLEAAREAVPGVSLEEAEIETEDGRTIYELEGEVEGGEVEIEVSEDGEVLEVEKEDPGSGSDDDDAPGKER